MKQVFGRGNHRSLKERMSAMYNDEGGLTNFAEEEEEEEEDSDGVDCTQDQDSIDLQRREELMDVMNNRSLTTKERTEKMDEIRAKYGLAEMRTKFTQAKSSYKLDLSAKSAAERRRASLDMLGKHFSLQDRMAMYNKQGERLAKKKEGQVVEVNNMMKEKLHDESRSEDVMEIKNDKFSDRGGTYKRDLSAKSASWRRRSSLEMLETNFTRKDRTMLKDRMAMYNKKKEGQVVEVNDVIKEKLPNESRREDVMEIQKDKLLGMGEATRRMDEIRQISASEANEKPPDGFDKKNKLQANGQVSEESASSHQSLDDQEHEELQSILGDKSLSKYERKQKMEQVWRKYVQLAQDEITSPPSTMKYKLDLSAKSAVERRRTSLVMLKKSIISNEDAVMSLSERKAMYTNDEFIIQ